MPFATGPAKNTIAKNSAITRIAISQPKTLL